MSASYDALRNELQTGLVRVNVPSGRVVYAPPAVKEQLEADLPTTPARNSRLSHESRVELARLRASITLDPSTFRSSIVDSDDQWIPGISEPEDVGIQATPEVVVYRGVATDVSRAGWQLEPGNPFRAVCLGVTKTVVEDNRPATEQRLHMDDAEFEFVQRDEDEQSILLRWNQPDDVLDELDAIEQADERAVWVERMTAFRRAQLHRLLTEYFGTSDYTKREIVLKWHRVDNKWTPAEKMNVLAWIEAKVEEKGSQLSGFASCAGTIRSKITRRRVSRDGTALWTQTYNKV